VWVLSTTDAMVCIHHCGPWPRQSLFTIDFLSWATASQTSSRLNSILFRVLDRKPLCAAGCCQDIRPASFSGGFVGVLFTGRGCSTNPQPGGQASVFITPEDRLAQLCSPAFGTHFSRFFRHAWATVGLLFPGLHTGKYSALDSGIKMRIQWDCTQGV
jgi:hypothetical protein